MYDTWLLELWLKEQDPHYINWQNAFSRRGWTESLLREYSEYIDWKVANEMIGNIFSLDFARQIRKRFLINDGEVLTYRGKVIL